MLTLTALDTPAWSGFKRIEEDPTLSPITWESQGLIAKRSGDMTRHLASGYGNYVSNTVIRGERVRMGWSFSALWAVTARGEYTCQWRVLPDQRMVLFETSM